MSKFSNDIAELLQHIGGEDNISTVSHCATRLRFVLKDHSKADVKKIESIKSVKGTFTYAGLTPAFGWLFAAIFGFAYAPLVITGLHHMTNAIDLQLMNELGGTNLWPMIALSNIAQGSAVLAIIFLHKGDEEEKQVSIPATISCYLGVTEPAMFGINLKYIYPFLAAMIGSSLASVFSVSTGVMANSIGVGGIPGILSIQGPHMFKFLIAMIIAIVVPFVLTIVFSKNKKLNKSILAESEI